MVNNWLLSGADVVPDQFTFSDITDAPLNTQYITTITPVGYDGFAAWSLDTGTANTTGNTIVGTTGIIGPGQSLFVRRTSSGNYSTTVDTALTINGITDTWSITTRAADTTPNPFSFTNVTSAERSNTYSSSVVLSGYDFASWNVTAVGGEAQGSNNGTTWTTSGTIFSGETFYIRANSGAVFGNVVVATANVGGVSNTFTVTVRDADTSPISISDTFTGASIFTQYTSNTLTVTGLESNYPVNVSISASSTATNTNFDAGTTSLTGIYSPTPRTITTNANGSFIVSIRGTTGASLNANYHTYLNVGSVNNAVTFTILTRQPDLNPDQFSFTDLTNVERSTQYTSSTISVFGLEPNYPITITASGGTIDAGTSALSGTFASSKTVTTSASGTLVMAARVTSSASFSSTVNCLVTIGSVSDTFSVTTTLAGELTYTTPGIYPFVAPTSSISILSVSPGMPGGLSDTRYSGRGGNLIAVNNYPVTPGKTYYIIVRAGGFANRVEYTGFHDLVGSQYIPMVACRTILESEGEVFASPGYWSAIGYGGISLQRQFSTGQFSFSYVAGGGGAPGYSPQYATYIDPVTGAQRNIGGNSGWFDGNPSYPVPTGGIFGGGGGGGASVATGNTSSVVAGGGGVGLFGFGSDGAGGTVSSPNGKGGSGGTNGTVQVGNSVRPVGGNYGAGGGTWINANDPVVSGGGGAVRIIYGAGRSFPYNAS